MLFVAISKQSGNVLVALPLNKQFSGRTNYQFSVI